MCMAYELLSSSCALAICVMVAFKGMVSFAMAYPAIAPPSIVVDTTCSAAMTPAATSAIFRRIWLEICSVMEVVGSSVCLSLKNVERVYQQSVIDEMDWKLYTHWK